MSLAIPKGVPDKFAALIKGKGLLAALQMLTPINLHFAILANQTYQKQKHDIAILLRIEGNAESLIKDPEDIQSLIESLLGEKGSTQKITVATVKYEAKEHLAVFVDRP